MLIIDTYGKGAFAILGDVKVKKGAICSLKRNEDNIHGNCRMHCTYVGIFLSPQLVYGQLNMLLLYCRSQLRADFGAT